jgi:SulP family sulfate permease
MAPIPAARPARPGHVLTHDAVAGFSVALMLVPQAIAFAHVVGLPPQHGLWASILPAIAAAFFASSPYLQTGPTAMTSLLTFGALSTVSAPGAPEYARYAALLALVVGAIRIGFGLVGWGWIAYLVSQPVMSAFTSGAALLIVLGQLPTALGVAAPDNSIRSALRALSHPGTWDLAVVALSAATVAVVLGARRVHVLLPGVLFAVVGGLAFNRLTGLGGATLGPVSGALPPFDLSLPWYAAPQLLVPALTIALVGFAEPAAIARTYAAQDRQPWDPDRELVSQGAACVAAAVSSGFPVGGSFSRTAVTRLAGARTRWAGAFAGLFTLAFLPAAPLISRLPRAVLSAIVIAAVMKVVAMRDLLGLARYSLPQAIIGWLTFVLTLALSPRIDQAIIVGLGFSVAVHLWREMPIRVRRSYAGTTLTLEPQGVLFFGSAPRLEAALLNQLSQHPEARHLVLDLEELGRIDFTGAVALKTVIAEAEEAGLTAEVRHVPQHARRILGRVLPRHVEDEPARP